MSPDAVLALQEIVDFCHAKWVEADQARDETPGLKTGRKIASNHVLQHARALLADERHSDPEARHGQG